MTLGFKQSFPWKEPTHFREKILAGVGRVWIKDEETEKEFASDKSWGTDMAIKFIQASMPTPFHKKIHTLRADPHNRWKAGRKIEMVYRGAGYKILSHFNKGIPELEKCVSTQKIEIEFNNKITDELTPCGVYIDNQVYWSGFVHSNGAVSCSSKYDLDKIILLVNNDGFNNTTDFFRWFKKDFTGKILHFSDLRY
jgi:hypothetical protein